MKYTQAQMKMHNAVDMYKDFKTKNPGSDVTYTLFKYIISKYNKGIVEEVLSGGTFFLGSNLGRLRVKRVKRDFTKKSADWGATKKLMAEGINRIVFFTDEYYYRFAWEKKYCSVKNKTAYQFKPAGGVHGPKKQLVELLRNDEFSHLNFV